MGAVHSLSDPQPSGLAMSFDTGGTDRLDVSAYTVPQRIDLRQETWSDVGGGINNIAIARGTVIENAVGGPYNPDQ